MLDTSECVSKGCLGVLQTSDVAAQQEMGGGIEGKPEEHIHHVHLALAQLDHQLLHMLFKDVDVAQPVLYKLWPNELS